MNNDIIYDYHYQMRGLLTSERLSQDEKADLIIQITMLIDFLTVNRNNMGINHCMNKIIKKMEELWILHVDRDN